MYLNTVYQQAHQKFTVPGPFGYHSFLHRITKPGVKIRTVLKKKICFMKERTRQAYTVKVILICENDYYAGVQNMPGLHRVLNMPEQLLDMPGYALICLYLSEWLSFYIYPL